MSLVAGSVAAADSAGPRQALSFEQSLQLLDARSDALAGAQAGAQSARDQADALQSLRLPVVSLDAQALAYQKTLDLSLGAVTKPLRNSTDGLLGDIAQGGVPGVGDDAVQSVIGEIRAALPTLFASLPDSLRLQQRRSLFHPTVTAVMPLYAGGAISAAQDGAQATVRLAGAKLEYARQALRLGLVQAYFGQVLAARMRAVTRATRDGFDHHLDNARKLEQHGQISHARVLQVQVARDAAQRAFDKARGQYRTAASRLANLLHSDDTIRPTSPLFVQSNALPPLQHYLDAAMGEQPQLRQAEAAVAVAEQGVKLAHARRLPTLYAFGQYNLNRRHALLTEPDWVVGIGLHYTLFSNVDRGKSESAARSRARAAQAAARQARVDIRTSVTKAWNLVESSRRQFLALDSSIAAAQESLRVQKLSFREGVAAASEVIDARNLLAQARSQRAAAAYQYDLALASLLLASGQSAQFQDYLQRADIRVAEHE